jgi:hypothetical protein
MLALSCRYVGYDLRVRSLAATRPGTIDPLRNGVIRWSHQAVKPKTKAWSLWKLGGKYNWQYMGYFNRGRCLNVSIVFDGVRG